MIRLVSSVCMFVEVFPTWSLRALDDTDEVRVLLILVKERLLILVLLLPSFCELPIQGSLVKCLSHQSQESYLPFRRY